MPKKPAVPLVCDGLKNKKLKQAEKVRLTNTAIRMALNMFYTSVIKMCQIKPHSRSNTYNP